eukprot:m.203492 g.203492  ORF g.203492 m.203492 type:complete len:159 (+) comp15372_c0_seq4:450-926(+)
MSDWEVVQKELGLADDQLLPIVQAGEDSVLLKHTQLLPFRSAASLALTLGFLGVRFSEDHIVISGIDRERRDALLRRTTTTLRMVMGDLIHLAQYKNDTPARWRNGTPQFEVGEPSQLQYVFGWDIGWVISPVYQWLWWIRPLVRIRNRVEITLVPPE